MLTQEADWGCRLPGLPRLPPAFFYRENAFNNIIIKLLYIPQFQKKNTRWVTEVTEVTTTKIYHILQRLPQLLRLLLVFFLFPQFLSLSPQKYPFYLRFPLKVLFFHEFSLYYTAILTTKYNINSKNQYAKKVLI